VVFKLGIGSNYADRELRYALRSLYHFKDLGKVFVVGHKPSWLNDEKVIHIPATDPYKASKDCNLINKLILASVHPELSDQFLNMSDDQVFLRDIDASFFIKPIYDNTPMSKALEPNKVLNKWQKRLRNTKNALVKNHYSYNCYETHMPCLINKHDFMTTIFKYDYGFDIGYVGNTLYYNTLRANGRSLRPIDLIRLGKKTLASQIIREATGKVFLNYTNKAMDENLLNALDHLFPNKSVYEK